ncbi:predicted protein [Histoplasma mississippiense (nom. inval.)]|uniref:predicted protein n=1 Tax=Ajellomyces capsulatus (strain NAm1 / WU24) TaxID=2059318 RepID=UPI000157CF6D|nr:predicted protein [Histoplasma mississippiense (nom. inval.)]EDN10769.1 predicted protein [Histoplasma mississippiense (nom. inval.)]
MPKMSVARMLGGKKTLVENHQTEQFHSSSKCVQKEVRNKSTAAKCQISSRKPIYPVCIFNGVEYSVNDKNEATYTPEPTAPFSPDTTASSAKSNNSGGDDATRTTNAPTISTDLSSAETVLRSTKDVTITVPPPTASTTAANAPLNSASATGRSPMANGNMLLGFVWYGLVQSDFAICIWLSLFLVVETERRGAAVIIEE